MPELLIIVAALLALVVYVVVVELVTVRAESADTVPLAPSSLADDLSALAEVLAAIHSPTCQCWDCHVRHVEAGRRTHEADQLDAQFEQSET